MGSSKLLVHQLTTLSHFLRVGLTRPSLNLEREKAARRAVELFPLWQLDSHMLPKKSNPFGYLNLFGTPRDVEERAEVFCEINLSGIFRNGVREAKKEAGEVGRAAALVANALKLLDGG